MVEKYPEAITGAKLLHTRRLVTHLQVAPRLTFFYYNTDCSAKHGWKKFFGITATGQITPPPVAADQAWMTCRDEHYSGDKQGDVFLCRSVFRYGNYIMYFYDMPVTPGPAGKGLFTEIVRKLDRRTSETLQKLGK